MDMLNPDIGSDAHEKKGAPSASSAVSNPPPPPTYPPPLPPPPPGSLPTPPPPPSYPAPQPPMEPSSAEFLKVKSNLRHVESNAEKRKVRKQRPVAANVQTKYKKINLDILFEKGMLDRRGEIMKSNPNEKGWGGWDSSAISSWD